MPAVGDNGANPRGLGVNTRLGAFAVVSALAFVWSHRFLPLQDFPDWLVQGTLLAHQLNDALPAQYSFKELPVPNAISTLCIGILSHIAPPELAGKLLLSGYVVGFAAASYYLLSAACRAVPAGIWIATLITLLSFPFFHGEINYALSLLVLYSGQGFVLRRIGREDVGTWLLVAAISTLIFFCHGAGYGLWLMFLTVCVWRARRIRTALACAAAVAPSVVLVAVYTLSRVAEPGTVVEGWSPIDLVLGFGKKLWLLFKFLAPFQGFYPFMDEQLAWILVLANLLAIGFVLYTAWHWIRERERSSNPILQTMRDLLALYALAFVLAPPQLGGLLNPAERIVLPAFHLALAYFAAARPEQAAAPRPSTLRVAWALLALQAIYIHGYGGFASVQLAAAYERLREYAVRTTAVVLHESHFRFEGRQHPARPLAWQLLPLHFPMLRITYYARLEAGEPLPIFETGLFRSTTHRIPNSAAAAEQIADDGPVVIVGWPPGNRAVARLLPKRLTPIESDEASFVVMSKRSP